MSHCNKYRLPEICLLKEDILVIVITQLLDMDCGVGLPEPYLVCTWSDKREKNSSVFRGDPHTPHSVPSSKSRHSTAKEPEHCDWKWKASQLGNCSFLKTSTQAFTLWTLVQSGQKHWKTDRKWNVITWDTGSDYISLTHEPPWSLDHAESMPVLGWQQQPYSRSVCH